jgi:hypothetical protein
VSVHKTPTVKQYARLRCIASPGCMLVSGISGEYRRTWEQLLRKGWVEAASPEISTENGLLITPSGLEALAVGLRTHGYPDGKAA